MGENISKAERYRDRAVEVRAIAESMTDREARQILFGVAADYEKMANQVERLHLDNRTPISSAST